MGNKTSKKVKNDIFVEEKNVIKQQELIDYYNNLKNFTCCVCFEENIDKMEYIYCKHEICKRCYYFINIKNNNCPQCRNEMELLFKPIKKTQYLKDPFQENLDYKKKELIEQMDIFNITKFDVKRISETVGKLATVGKGCNNDLYIYYFPYFNNEPYQIINNFYKNNNFLFITLKEDLEKNNYNIWYDTMNLFNWINTIIN
jgi:hypothetical protein